MADRGSLETTGHRQNHSENRPKYTYTGEPKAGRTEDAEKCDPLEV